MYSKQLNMENIKHVVDTAEEYVEISKDTFKELEFEKEDIDFFKKSILVRLFQRSISEFNTDDYLDMIEMAAINKEIRETKYILKIFKENDIEIPIF